MSDRIFFICNSGTLWEIHIQIFLSGTCELLNWNQALIKLPLDGPFPKLCLVVPPSDQDGCTAVFSLTEDPMGNSHKSLLVWKSSSIRTKLWWNSHWIVLFQNCVWQSRSPTKMAVTVQLRCYWKQLWSRWAITGSWEPLVYIRINNECTSGTHQNDIIQGSLCK
jgi:hypothetical protein